MPWLEPMPGRDGRRRRQRPGRRSSRDRDSIRLAFVAALQHLPPRQRAVLILRDVLRWRAAEVAEMLDTTTAAVNSALQRARAQLDQAAPTEDAVAEPSTPEQRELLDRYVAAFESYDINALVDAVHRATRSGRCRRSPAGTRAPPTSAGSSTTQCPAKRPATCG